MDGRAVCADAGIDLRYREQGFDPFVHHRCTGELAACERTDFDGAVAPAEQPVSAGDTTGVADRKTGRGAGGWDDATQRIPAVGDGGGASVSGGYRLDDEPRRGLAVHPGWTIPRARVGDGVAAGGLPCRPVGASGTSRRRE